MQAAAGADSSFWASLPAAATGLLQAVAYILAGYYATGGWVGPQRWILAGRRLHPLSCP